MTGPPGVSGVTVRAADLGADADGLAIVEILDSYARESVAGARPLAPDVRARLPGALRAHPTTVAFVADADATPVGVAVCWNTAPASSVPSVMRS